MSTTFKQMVIFSELFLGGVHGMGKGEIRLGENEMVIKFFSMTIQKL